MEIIIIKPGLLSSIQDHGRYLFLDQGVPVSGVMDILSARMANIAIGNDENEAVLEFTYGNAEFKTSTNILIAYSGEGGIIKSADLLIPSDRPVFIPSGTTLSLIKEASTTGSRTYLSVAGGWDVPEILGSRSTYLSASFGGLCGRLLQARDTLKGGSILTPITNKILNTLSGIHINYTDWSLPKKRFNGNVKNTIRIIMARESSWFDSESVSTFLSAPYTLSLQSNRMGYHLEGAMIKRVKNEELLSTAVTPGTIQVTGSGSLVLLMADCQTTGGYPRIAQVAAVDLSLCGQLSPGNVVYFTEIKREQAEKLYIERDIYFQNLTKAVNNRFA